MDKQVHVDAGARLQILDSNEFGLAEDWLLLWRLLLLLISLHGLLHISFFQKFFYKNLL